MNDEQKRNDLAEIFDMDRSQAIARMTANFENRLRDIQTAQDDLKELVASCKEAGLAPKEIAAMRRIAKIRLTDQAGQVREELESLHRVGKACGLDLFSWGAAQE